MGNSLECTIQYILVHENVIHWQKRDKWGTEAGIGMGGKGEGGKDEGWKDRMREGAVCMYVYLIIAKLAK